MADNEYALPLSVEGSVTAPTGTFVFTEPSAESVTELDVGPANVLEIEEFGWIKADGVNPMKAITKGSVYTVGGIAPGTAPTLAEAGGTRASVVGTYTGQPADGETITIGPPANPLVITWKTTVTIGSGALWQVKIGVDDDTSYANLKKFIEQTGTWGNEYGGLLAHAFLFGSLAGNTEYIHDYYHISAETHDTGAGTLAFQYIEYGTIGNVAVSTETTSNFTFASATLTGGADGTGTTPLPGSYRYFYTWHREADGAETGRSPVATITHYSNTNITVTVTASADTTFDYINIYRTPTGGAEFYLTGATPRGTLSFTDDTTDEVLVEKVPWSELLHRDYVEGPPPRGLALAMFKNQLWTTGAKKHADYTRGTVTLTKDSATATFSVQGITTNMVGRALIEASTNESFRILSVDETAKTCVLHRKYTGWGAGGAGKSFRIVDDYDAAKVRCSVAFLWNQWPEDNSPGRVDTDDADGGTALLATRHRLFAFSKTSTMSITGDGPENWDINRLSGDVGCVAQCMMLQVEGGGMFLSTDGFYAISPDETLINLSSPKAPRRSLAQGIDKTINRVAWENVENGYSLYNKEDREAIFGVPLDGATTPNYEIVYNLNNFTWTLNKRASWTAMTEVRLPDGSYGILSGDRDGHLWHAWIGQSDGFYGTEAVQTISSATTTALTVSGTPFSTTGDGEEGKPVIVLYADGTTVAVGKVASNTSSILTLAEDLATAPAANDQIVLGGIAWQAKTGFTTFGEEYRKKFLRSVTIRHAPTTRGDYWLSFAVDGGSFRLCPVGPSTGSLAQSDGKVRHRIQWPGDTHAINLRGFKPGGQAILRGGVFDVAVRELGRV